MNDLTKLLINAVEKIVETWSDFREDGKITAETALKLIYVLISMAEKFINIADAGKLKHKVVREAFDHFDQKYHLVDKLDDAVKLPFWAEPFDGLLLSRAIDLLISMTVMTLNRAE